MRLVFAGSPEMALPALAELVASEHEVVAVITRPDARVGRGRKLQATPVADYAIEHGIEVLKPSKPGEPEFLDQLRDLAPEVCPVVAYGALLPEAALAIPTFGWINLHFSILPRWRGAAPVQHAIMAGDSQIGTSCFRIVPALDAGPSYRTQSIPMPIATAGELLQQLAESGAGQLLATLDDIANGKEPTAQSAEGITLAPKVTVDQARIDWMLSADELVRLILGCSPAPGAWCEFAQGRFKVFDARVEADRGLAPAQLEVTKYDVFVGTGQGTVRLLEVQAPGKRRLPARDWARGGNRPDRLQ